MPILPPVALGCFCIDGGKSFVVVVQHMTGTQGYPRTEDRIRGAPGQRVGTLMLPCDLFLYGVGLGFSGM